MTIEFELGMVIGGMFGFDLGFVFVYWWLSNMKEDEKREDRLMKMEEELKRLKK